MNIQDSFSNIFGEGEGERDIFFLVMTGLVIFMVVLSETALVFATSGLFLLLSNLFYFPLILFNLKFYEKGLAISTVLGIIYFAVSLMLIELQAENILISFSIMVTYIAVGISISFIYKTYNESRKNLINSINSYEDLFEEIQDAIIVYDSNGSILGVNNGVSRLFGLDRKYVSFLKIDDLAGFIGSENLKKAFYDVTLSGSVFTDTELRQSDGTLKYVEIHSGVINPAEGVMRAYIRDVTGRVLAEQKIQASEARYRHLTNQLPEMIFELDVEGNFLFATRYSINIAGRTPEELEGGIAFWDILIAEDRARARKNLEWFYKGMFLGAVEYRIKKPDGIIIPVLVHFSYDFDDDNSVRGIRGVAMDITQRKRMETALRRNEKKFRGLFENSNDAVIIFNKGGCIVDINNRLCLMLGINRDDAVSCNLESRFPDSEWKKVSGMYRDTPGEGIFFESRMQHSKGHFIDVEISSGIIDPEEGLYQAILRDISERKRALAELAVSRERLNLAIEGAGMCVWDWDMENDEMHFEGNYNEMFNPDDLIGGPSGTIWREILQKEFYSTIIGLFPGSPGSNSSGSGPKTMQFESEYKFRTGEGSYKWITVLGKIVEFDESGNPVRIAGIMQDVSDKKRSQGALYEANKKLNLLSSITRHDILNQIVGVRGFTDILAKRLPEENSELLHYLDMIKKATLNIQEQITFTRDYQNIGVESPAWQNLGNIIESSRSRAQLRGVVFSNKCGGLEIYADPMIEKIFFNLLDNAMRHGSGVNCIEVSCERCRGDLKITVRDDGVGVPYDLKEKIFDHGYGSNTGLGLFLVREILGITGMEINEVGEPGKGAVFEIQIPADNVREAA